MFRASPSALFAFLFFLAFGHARCYAQNTLTGNATILEAIGSFFLPLILPKVVQDAHRLKEYVRSDEYAKVRVQYGDLMAVDELYARALELSWSNRYEALFISFLATMDHRRFGIHIPLAGALLWFPLTSEFEDEYRERVRALPVKLYCDTPNGPFGDRDKLQHFFGSAFLAYLFESREATLRVGDMIEGSEEQFVVDGAFDERDLRANRHGQAFGMSLLEGSDVVPSEFLQLVTAREISGLSVDEPQPDQFPAKLCRPQQNWQESFLEEK